MADAKATGGRASLPGVDWSPLNDGAAGSAGEAWQATALSQRRPLVMRTSDQFYGTLERCVFICPPFFSTRGGGVLVVHGREAGEFK